jgi:integrase/recombinase XerC
MREQSLRLQDSETTAPVTESHCRVSVSTKKPILAMLPATEGEITPSVGSPDDSANSLQAVAAEAIAAVIAAARGQLEKPRRNAIESAMLPVFARDWLFDCETRGHTKATIESRRIVTERLHWFCSHSGFQECGAKELRQFFAYLQNGHEKPEGRWGHGKWQKRFSKPLSPRTVRKTYWNHLHTFFEYLAGDGVLDESPFAQLRPPELRQNQIVPFTTEEVRALLKAAQSSRNAPRDVALILFLLDTGARVSEVCALRIGDVDMKQRHVEVMGKGRKTRKVFFARNVQKALYHYTEIEPRENDAPLFTGDKNSHAGLPLTRSGVLQVIHRLGKAAGITRSRCSPHTFRHTFAVEFLRAGGNAFTLKELLGHTSMHITNRYVQLAEADLENQHRQFSPADKLGRL